MTAVRLLALLALVAASSAGTAGAAVHPTTLTLAGTVASISADGGVAAMKVTSTVGTRLCASALVWQTAANRKTQIGGPACRAHDSTDESFDSLTIAATRVAWGNYDFGNHGYCTGLFTETLAQAKPTDLGICDGTEADTYYDLAGNGPLLVTREYTQCDADCPPDYSETYQMGITLYQVADKLVKVGPLKRDTQLEAVDAGRLLLANGKTLEVVAPLHGANAVFMTTPTIVGEGFLSGNDALAVGGTQLTVYDATTGQSTSTRTLPSGSKVSGFTQGIVAYVHGRTIHLLRIADGRDRTVTTVNGLVGPTLDTAGLFYAENTSGRSRVTFLSLAALLQLLNR